jgi:hypothetical protein
MGDIFSLKTGDRIKKKILFTRLLTGSTDQIILSPNNFCFFYRSFTFFFLVFHTLLFDSTSDPSGRVGRLGVRLCLRPWVGPSGPALAGLPFAAGRLSPRAADLVCVRCRVGCSAVGRTARAAAARAWAAAAAPALAAQVWPPGSGWSSAVSPPMT